MSFIHENFKNICLKMYLPLVMLFFIVILVFGGVMGRLVQVSACETQGGQDLQWDSLEQIEDSVRLRFWIVPKMKC